MSPAAQSTTAYTDDFEVGDWQVRPMLNRLERHGHRIQLEPKAMEVLVELARQAGKPCSKRHLFRVVWGDAFVGDQVLTQVIFRLRAALGDEAKKPRYIETIPAKGYRLKAPVTGLATRVFHYRLLERLGGGGMGVVHKAEDIRLKREVALKFLPIDLSDDPTARERFEREAQAAASLDHPHIAVVHDFGESPDGRVFIAMAYYDGESIKKKIERGPLPVAECLGLAEQIARGLAAAHEGGIVHRDIKPANVMVTCAGEAKIVDFGLAKLTGMGSLTRAGATPGTLAYMSPEQLLDRRVDRRSDLWSLGVVLFEMLSGQRPFDGASDGSAVQAILSDEPKRLEGLCPQCPRAALEVVYGLLQKEPGRRLSDASEVAERLARARSAATAAAPDVPSTDLDETLEAVDEAAPRWGGLSSARAVVAGLLALSILAVGLWLLSARGAPEAWFGTARNRRTDPELEIRDQEARRMVEQAKRYEQRGYARSHLTHGERLYRGALAREPDNPLIQARLAALLAQVQRSYPDSARRAEILALASEALALREDLAPAWIARSVLHTLEGEAAEAERAAREALRLAPEDFSGYKHLGESLIAQGRVEEGLAELRKGADVGTGYVWGHEALGVALVGLARYEEAESELRRVVDLAPDSPASLSNLGAIYLFQGRDADAVPLIHRALELEPQSVFAAANLGVAYFNLGRFDEAITAFQRAHELAPERPEYLQYVGEAHERLGDPETARQWFARALSGCDAALAAGGPRARLLGQRAVAAAKLGRHARAATDIAEALALAPADAEQVYLAAQVFALAGDTERVLDYTRRALEAGHSRDWFHTDPAFDGYRDHEAFRALLEHGSAAR